MNDSLIDSLVRQLKEFAVTRSQNVARGFETPNLAAHLLQVYGLGLIAAATTILKSDRIADPIYKALNEETDKIDPL
ncbi:hypothetical protein PSI15_07685 [Xenorhabdus sp. PR6a]|uniref:hypothetical protein n=1 Tax=Xenorhabdus sp. PR6a TaxID=3025877 RepID=UPI002358F0FE|nr:hypothetical protein [Xenorhabdus sp. PR6a]MDC9581442.1 hypothetical protein [Xenorhabdus sp. PR6a]